ncbi:MAG: SET domain-containing protein-lysine N-methyltransferase [Chloroflexi bacterium]|nr:SET domain-containing protein-lysine N-methyltransferase [Chloroflexota bacterium]MCC6894979.1 SET domain-containing protein-lysine N-methyltransferase [Anaerolineae bacterium]
MSTQWLTKTIYVAPSSIDNVGIFSLRPLRAGETIYTVTGKFVRNEYSAVFALLGPNWIGVSKELWLDPDQSNPMNFMNHSCEPNAIVTEGLNVVALRDIPVHEEIVMDYSTTEIDPYWQMDCHCGRATCRKAIRAFQFLPTELRQRYEGQMLATLVAAAPLTSKVG